jgi:large subunit ribosomal protein L33
MRQYGYGSVKAARLTESGARGTCPRNSGGGIAALFFSASQGEEAVMAKPTTVKIKLVSSADTGFYYVTKKNPRNITEKLSFRKYDPIARKHVEFKEAKIK